MENNLKERTVYKMSGFEHYNLSYYVVGIDAKGNLTGCFVGATET
jgi:hypothetical protein